MSLGKAFTEEVKQQADIVRIISDYVTLKKRGQNYLANCPFHNEKTPSFNVNPGKQIFHCFGCSAGGDVFGFIMQIEHCSFVEAVKTLAEKLGIPIPAPDPKFDDRKFAEERETLLQINSWATDYFQEQLGLGSEGQRALEYLEKRGITAQTRTELRLGYAPDRWDGLLNTLRGKGVANPLLERSGLVIAKEQGGGYYDRFRGRCIFPITDTQNRVIAFGGRIIGEGEPKYLNSPETPLYSKGRNLFGLSYAKEAIRKQRFAILVEGYLDFLTPYQEGVKNIVASLGTALTEQQVRLLGRFMEQPQIIVNFDPDTAGIAATKRSLEILIEQGYKVNVLSLPNGQDPDTFIRTHGVSEYRQLLKKSQPYLEYILTQSIREHDLTKPAGKVEALNAILPFLAKMPNRIERAEYADRIADRLKLSGSVVREELKRAAVGKQEQLDIRKLTITTRILPAEKRLLEILLASAPMRRLLISRLTTDLYGDLVTAPIFAALIELIRTDQEINFASLKTTLGEEALPQSDAIISSLMVSSTDIEQLEDADLRLEAERAFAALGRMRLEQQMTVLQAEINQAQREGNSSQVTDLSLKKLAIARRLKELFA